MTNKLLFTETGYKCKAATGPSGVIYTLRPCTIAADLSPGYLLGNLRSWFAKRGEIELNDEPVSLDEAVELCEDDARELRGDAPALPAGFYDNDHDGLS